LLTSVFSVPWISLRSECDAGSSSPESSGRRRRRRRRRRRGSEVRGHA